MKKTKTTAKKATKPAKTSKPCACGCKGEAQRQFLPGHDQRLKGLLIRVQAGQDGTVIPAVAIERMQDIAFLNASPYRAIMLGAAKPAAKRSRRNA